MSAWEAVSAVAGSVSAVGIVFLGFQVSEARRARGVSEVAAYNDARGRMDDAAPRVEVHVEPAGWPPLGPSSVGTPQPYPPATEWHFPQRQDQHLLLQTGVVVTNRSESTVYVQFEGDLWEVDSPDGRPRRMRPEMLLGPGEAVRTLMRGGISLKQWSEIDARVRGGEQLGEPVVSATITVHSDADEGVVDVWKPWLTGTPIAEDPSRGSVWRLTPPPIDGGDHGDWCLSYDLQPPRHRSYWLSREQGEPLREPHRK